MGKKKNRKKKKKHLARLRQAAHTQNVQETRPVEESKPATPPQQESSSPSISLATDSDATPPQSKVSSQVKKIAILMTCLAAVVIVVAILNVQTNYINDAGQWIMQTLHVYGS